MSQPTDDARPAEPMTAEREQWLRDHDNWHGPYERRSAETMWAEIDRLRAEIAERDASFQIRWDATLRAIELWHKAGNPEMKWPGHTDLCVWLMGQLAAARAEVQSLSLTVADAMTRLREAWRERDAMRAAIENLRHEVLRCNHEEDGLDCDKVNYVLGMIDNHTAALLTASAPASPHESAEPAVPDAGKGRAPMRVWVSEKVPGKDYRHAFDQPEAMCEEYRAATEAGREG